MTAASLRPVRRRRRSGWLLSIGDRLVLQRRDRQRGSRRKSSASMARCARVMAYDALWTASGPAVRREVSRSASIGPAQRGRCLRRTMVWLGRVVDPLGRPLDGKAALLPRGDYPRPVRADPPAAATRARLGERLDLGVTALNLFATCRAGQRLGLFAGSGVGKSTLLAMLARNTACDVAVLALGRRTRAGGEGVPRGRSRRGGIWHARSSSPPPPTPLR